MKFTVEIDGKKYNILTFTANIKCDVIDLIGKYNDGLNVIVQVVPEDLTVSHRHLAIATYYAIRGHIRGRNIAKTPHLEVLLYLYGTRQITKVIHELNKCVSSRYSIVIASTQNPEEILSKMIESGEVEVLSFEGSLNSSCRLCRFGKGELTSFYGSEVEALEKALILRSVMLNVKF